MTRITMAREAKGMSQKELAGELNVSCPTVSEWESGKKNPTSSNLRRLSKVLGVSVDYLINTDDNGVAKTSDFTQVVSVAERLKQAMELNDIKQIDLVRETGINRSSISRYLSGEYEPKSKSIRKLASALQVSEQWLLGYDVPISPAAEAEIAHSSKVFASRLRAARYASKRSQQDLASRLDITQQAYAKYENGTSSPNPETLSDIADILGVSVDYLLGRNVSIEKEYTVIPDDELVKELVQLLNVLSPEKRRQVVDFARFLNYSDKA